MFKSLSSALLWRGLLAVVIGMVSVAWPGITVGAQVRRAGKTTGQLTHAAA